MNRRNVVRYDSDALPGILNKVTVSWEGNTLGDAYAVNYCSTGISLAIPTFLNPPQLPAEGAIVRVLMPVGQVWLTGKCVYLSTESDGSACLGIHFPEPKEQTYLKDVLFNSLNVFPTTTTFVSYEWEELVAKLCSSDDPKLKQLGQHHLAIIKAKQFGHQEGGVSL